MEKNYNEDLEHIRSMMERSTRFISLSGFSGIFIGIVGLIATFLLFKYQDILTSSTNLEVYRDEPYSIFVILGSSLVIAIAGAVFFTIQKSKKLNLPVWSAVTKRVLFSLGVPLAAGGLFCLNLVDLGLYSLILPSTLIFYGLALFSAGKYTFKESVYLGAIELGLGIIALFMPGLTLWVWGIGFGVIHILYGLMVQRKYH